MIGRSEPARFSDDSLDKGLEFGGYSAEQVR